MPKNHVNFIRYDKGVTLKMSAMLPVFKEKNLTQLINLFGTKF